MGIQAPSGQDTFTLMVSTITSYNHLLYLIGAAVIAFGIAYYMLKKSRRRTALSIAISLVSAVAVALYFIWSTLTQVRY